MRHEAWSDGSFFPASNRSARALVEDGATVVWSVEATSWAVARYYGWRGWEPYRPMCDDPGACTAAGEAEASGVGSSGYAEPGAAADGGGM